MSPDDAGSVRVEVCNRIATITLDRPERLNAMTTAMFVALMAALDRLDEDDDIRAGIVTGAGRAFCAGADVSGGPGGFTGGTRPAGNGDRRDEPAMPPRPGGGSADRRRRSPSSRGRPEERDGGGVLVLRILACKKPLLAAVNGAAVGLGATMTLPMDFRLAATSARFGFVFGRRGIVPDGASSWFLPRVVGIGRALDWVETGRIFGSDEALAAGLVGSVHEPDKLLDAAWEIAATIRDNVAPVSVAVSRQLLWRMTMAPDPMEAHRLESRLIAQRAASPDAAEGVQAFLEKRAPVFPMKVSTDLPEPYPWWEELPFT